jgi:hypothetical protein
VSPVFRPNQIRHTVATRVRQEFILEHAQVILGHSKADMTQQYAERNLALASDVASKIGQGRYHACMETEDVTVTLSMQTYRDELHYHRNEHDNDHEQRR